MVCASRYACLDSAQTTQHARVLLRCIGFLNISQKQYKKIPTQHTDRCPRDKLTSGVRTRCCCLHGLCLGSEALSLYFVGGFAVAGFAVQVSAGRQMFHLLCVQFALQIEDDCLFRLYSTLNAGVLQ